MKIAIVGAGVAGSYLSFHLSKQHSIDVYEKRVPEELAKDCAWGTSWRTLKQYCSVCDLSPEDYLFHICDEFHSTVYVNRDTISFDKRQFFLDILKKSEAKVHYDTKIRKNDITGYDLIIDATGAQRTLLPKSSNSPAKWLIPNFQAEIYSTELPPEFLFDPRGIGYFWIFPQAKNRFKVGCGSFNRNPKKEVEAYLANKEYKSCSRKGGLVRMLPPSKSQPFYVKGSPPIIGVGESIGTVAPISGEGITPTLYCADLFINTLEKGEKIAEIAKLYEQQVLTKFQWIENQFKFIKSLRFHNRLTQLWNLLHIKIPSYAAWEISKIGMIYTGIN